jgi:hypothetical protein
MKANLVLDMTYLNTTNMDILIYIQIYCHILVLDWFF